jgi:molybdopterin-guanine dinucleotide biosynthesis protein A/N-acetylglutamate synthase-like GNAT family acetyltransferase
VATGGLTGILLVGGASRRFGSPKAHAQLEGETLAARAWRTLGEVCAERLAVGKAEDALALPFELLDDGTDVRAPIAGLVAGLRVARHEVSVVVPVDTPLVRSSHLQMLAEHCRDAAVPPSGPLPGAYRRSALPVLQQRLGAGELALRDALAALDVAVVELPQHVLVNVNEPEDLARLEPPIVPFAAEHADGFRSLVSDTLREFGFEPDAAFDPDLDDPAQTYAALWVVLEGDEVVGSIALRDLGERRLELKRMYLRPSQRGRGLGRRLLATAVEWARAQGTRTIRLDTTGEMEAARHLYEQHGFRRIPGEAPRQGQQRLLYELEL